MLKRAGTGQRNVSCSSSYVDALGSTRPALLPAGRGPANSPEYGTVPRVARVGYGELLRNSAGSLGGILQAGTGELQRAAGEVQVQPDVRAVEIPVRERPDAV